MKLRIKGNSIRLRLLKSEVEKFAQDGHISDRTSFGTSELLYTLAISKDARSIVGTFDKNEITISLPEQMARDWATNDVVGFETEQAVGSNEILTIIIEKDFVCIDRPDDPDREDAYPNPNVVC
jgi:hypothetical protein